MTESNFLKEFCIATKFLQNFQSELEYLKNVQTVTRFSKIHIVIHLHPSHH